MGLLDPYGASPETIRAAGAAVAAHAGDVDDLTAGVGAAHAPAQEGVAGLLRGPMAHAPTPVRSLALALIERVLFAGAALELFARQVESYNAAVSSLAAGLSQTQADAVPDTGVVQHRRLLQEELDGAADQVVALLETGPTDDAIDDLHHAGVLPEPDILSYHAVPEAGEPRSAGPVGDVRPRPHAGGEPGGREVPVRHADAAAPTATPARWSSGTAVSGTDAAAPGTHWAFAPLEVGSQHLGALLPERAQQWLAAIVLAAQRHDIDPRLLLALILHESAFRMDDPSPAGAIGLTQLMPDTARGLGVDPYDPIENLDGGARYLRQQLDRFGSVPLALAAYNAGPGSVRAAGGIPRIEETQVYVRAVMTTYGALAGVRPVEA